MNNIVTRQSHSMCKNEKMNGYIIIGIKSLISRIDNIRHIARNDNNEGNGYTTKNIMQAVIRIGRIR